MDSKVSRASASDASGNHSVQRSDNRRSQVIAAAARQLRENGYAATSMRKIASEAGILAGSIYYHFLSKEDLMSAVHDEGLKQINASVRRAMEKESDPWLRLEAACAAHTAAILEADDFAGVVLADISRVSPDLQKLLNDQRNGYEEVFRQQLVYYLQPGDAVLLVSSSGNSPNVVNACSYAKERGVPTIAFVGFKGGRLQELADHCVWIPIENYGIAEDAHQSLMHVLTQYLSAHLAGEVA